MRRYLKGTPAIVVVFVIVVAMARTSGFLLVLL